MFYVYRFLDKKKNIIYVGKSKQELELRFRRHLHLPDACYDLTYKIEYIECTTESDMSIKEIYYINKYRHGGDFFNVLDTTDIPVSVEFNDNWKQYIGPLGSHFCHSINYIKSYTTPKEVRYNKDGSVDQRKSNKQKGVDSYVEGLTYEETNLIVEHLINKINNAVNDNQEQICFRNLVMFILSVNLPLKPSEFLSIKYGDLFDEDNRPKSFAWQLGRFHKDETIDVPLRKVVCEILIAYTQKYGLTYKENAEDSLFQSRKHQVVSLISWGRILKEAAEAVGMEKNIGAESVRKTYGINVFERSADRYNALLFLSELWGQTREAQIIRYLNLTNSDVDFDYYLGETFSLGTVDLSKIKCLKVKEISIAPNTKKDTTNKERQHFAGQVTDENKSVKKPIKETKTNRLWPKEKKLEIVLKHLDQHIPQKDLANQYGVDSANISRWVSEYKKYGASVFEDKRFKKIKG